MSAPSGANKGKGLGLMWNSQNEALAARMWQDGYSYSDIARRVGKSRNAIIGKLHRMGLNHANREESSRRAQERERARAARERVRGAAKPESAPRPPRTSARAKAAIQPAKPGGIPLEALTDTTCRWPITEVTPHRFCGCEAVNGPYCEAHTKLGRAGAS